MVSLTAVLLVSALAVVISLLFRRNGKKLPPGPMGIPILGNLLQMGAMPHLKMVEWVDKYGKILQVHLGTKKLIVISDAKLIREAFSDPNLTGRMDHAAFQLFAEGGPHGIVNSEGEEWAEQRRFTLRNLRDLGFGKKGMESLIMDEVNDVMAFLKSNEDKPVSLARRLNIAILNAIWSLLSSSDRLSQDDPRYVDIFDRQKVIIEDLAKSFTFFAPGLSKLMPKMSGWTKMVEFSQELAELFQEHVAEHKKNVETDGSEPKDFIEAYLREVRATKDPNSSFYKEKGERSLRAIMGDFFGAGPDTTSSTIAWSVLYLSKFPEVQKKVQAELDEVVGKQRQPTLADRTSLPYTCAAIEEVLRQSSIVPLGVFHRALADVNFHGYDIPKGTWICHNQYYLQNSKMIWGNPDVFQPERHLTNGGKTVKRDENLMAFGTGKRVCVGESLARDSVYLFFVNIFHKYEIRLSDESANVTLDAVPGFVLPPQDYKIVLKDRL